MKNKQHARIIAIFISLLIISLPMALAQEYQVLHDANVNMIWDEETDVYLIYNELNQLSETRQNNATGILLQKYTFDPIEERIFIKDEYYPNGSLKSSTYYFDDDYVVIQNSSGTYNRTNIYQDGILVGYEDFDGKKRYVLPDHEGSVHIVLNESGDVIEENLFSPFAEPLHGVIENKFSYEAKEYDSLVQDYDFHARKYNPNLRIFMQPDTLIQNVYDPQSLNRYSFERNNPQKNTDPTGHVVWYIAIPLAIIITIILDYAYDKYYGDKNKNPNLAESGAAGGASEGIGQAAEKGLGKSAGKALPGVFDIIMEIPLTSSEDVCRTEAECVQKIEPKKEQTEEDLKCKIINCNYKYGVISDDNEDNRQSGSPSISNPSSQADSSKA